MKTRTYNHLLLEREVDLKVGLDTYARGVLFDKDLLVNQGWFNWH